MHVHIDTWPGIQPQTALESSSPNYLQVYNQMLVVCWGICVRVKSYIVLVQSCCSPLLCQRYSLSDNCC
ncbi:hypothetical protein Y1Q_0021896 [Alligator mississippiensis]|uniref:Uncharacterized protein n=1 Tax=Alligator mississippiensis TaxID=8496 RepID=A0A151M624_ALLMI|nr:hypothetical protein Y1Q_0021896 [Alligator mississippiensis]